MPSPLPSQWTQPGEIVTRRRTPPTLTAFLWGCGVGGLVVACGCTGFWVALLRAAAGQP